MGTEPPRGWTIGRTLGLIVAVLAMSGLGAGSACGLLAVVGLPAPPLWLVAGVAGCVILFILFLRLAEAIVRRADGRMGDRR